MATSKAKSKSKAPAAKAKKTAAPKKAAPMANSVAVKTLSTLPALTGKLRAAFRQAFSDAQCDAWGEQTKAENVRKEAEKFVATMARTLKDGLDVAYSRRRLAYLCELLVLLEDEIAHTNDSEMSDLRGSRNAALAVATNARRDLSRRIRALAGGQEAVLKAVAEAAPGSESSATDVQDSLTATIDIAVKLRRNEVTEALADDIGLDEPRLNSAYAALEVLAGARDLSLNAAAYEGDAPSVNRIEGRVLREMRLAQRLFNEAREEGITVPALVVGPSLNAIFRRWDAGVKSDQAVVVPQ